MIAPAVAEFAPAQTFELPKPPGGDAAAARQMARALRECARELLGGQAQAHAVLADAHQHWTGTSARAANHPLCELDARTGQVTRVLHDAADRFQDYAHVLDKAHEQHHWSLGKILTVAAVVVVTTTVVVVTVGAAAPAAAAADAAIVGAEVAATTAAVGTASATAVEAAEAITLAVRALQALRAVATFLKPQIAVTAGLTDYDAFHQVRSTGHLNLTTLTSHTLQNTAYGIAGGRLARTLSGAVTSSAAHPLTTWLLPSLATSTAWAATTTANDYVETGKIDPWDTATAALFALGGTATETSLTRYRTRLQPEPPPPAPLSSEGVLLIHPDAARTRVLRYRPRALNPKWGFTKGHLSKHMFGEGPIALRVIDPGSNTDRWLAYLQDLAGRPATASLTNGVEDVMGLFPRADGSGTFRLGIRVAPHGDGTFDLVTILTKQ